MALFTAVQAGAMDDGATFGNTSPGTIGVDFPDVGDSVELAGYALTQGAITQIFELLDSTLGSGALTMSNDLNIGTATDARIEVGAGCGAKTLSGTFNWTGAGNCITVGNDLGAFSGTLNLSVASSGNGIFIEGGSPVTLADMSGMISNDGSGNGIKLSFYGVLTNMSGTIGVPFGGCGIRNTYGTITDITGTINNYSSDVASKGMYNEGGGTITALHGTIYTNKGAGIFNEGTITLIASTMLPSDVGSDGNAIFNSYLIETISGAITAGNGFGVYNNSSGGITTISSTITTVNGTALLAGDGSTVGEFSGNISSGEYGTGIYFYPTGNITTMSGVVRGTNPLKINNGATSITGTVYTVIPNLSAANVKKDVVILHVTGTLASTAGGGGINGSAILGMI